MRVKPNRLPETYAAALRKYLNQGVRARLQPALRLGSEAVGLKLATLDLARIHEAALAALELAGSKNGWAKRAEKFFNEANSCIKQTHRAERQPAVHWSRLKETLDQRTEELAATNRQLKRGIVRRKAMQEALEKNGSHYKSSLEESLQLQNRLRQLTHRVMATQEDDRKNISRELHDEIAQTLLGINVRLLSLKQEARNHSAGIKRKIASTQRLVVRSVRSVRRVAREINS